MTLLDLRRHAIRNRVRIEFTAPGVGACTVNEHGVLKIPSLAGPPKFRFDSSLAGIEQFVLTPVGAPSRAHRISRSDLEALLADSPPAGVPHDE